MFELAGAGYRYPGGPGLAPTTRTFRPGSLTVIIGPNGAGKTTLLKLLTGELPPTTGEVLLDGIAMRRYRPSALATRRAVLAQSNHLSFPFSVREVVRMGLLASRTPPADVNALIDRLLDEAGLDGYQGRLYQQLSGGEQQRVQLARVRCQLEAAAGPPDKQFLFLDEPIASLDIRHQLETMELARQRSRRGSGVIAILHDLNMASRYADEILVLSEGRILIDAAPRIALSPEILEEAFGVTMQVLGHTDGRPRLLPA